MLNLCVIIVISIYKVKASYGDPFYVITLYSFPKCALSSNHVNIKKEFHNVLHIMVQDHPNNRIFLNYLFSMYIMVDWNMFL